MDGNPKCRYHLLDSEGKRGADMQSGCPNFERDAAFVKNGNPLWNNSCRQCVHREPPTHSDEALRSLACGTPPRIGDHAETIRALASECLRWRRAFEPILDAAEGDDGKAIYSDDHARICVAGVRRAMAILGESQIRERSGEC